jgi:hypothetical protein
VTPETCRHCGYGIPSDSSTCPGCTRRHSPSEAAFARLAVTPHQHSPLLRTARRARRTIFLAGWLAIAFGLAGLVHTAVYVDRVIEDLPDEVPGRVTDVANGLTLATLVAVVLVALATALWTRRARHNVHAFGPADGAWSAWSLGAWALPGRAARERKRLVDARWRNTSPVVSHLHRAGDTRTPVSQVVLRWWALWAWVPALAVVLVIVVGRAFTPDDSRPELGLAALAASALLIVALRSLYDVIGIVTVAHAHRIADGDREPPATRWIDARLDQDDPEALTTTSTAGPTG